MKRVWIYFLLLPVVLGCQPPSSKEERAQQAATENKDTTPAAQAQQTAFKPFYVYKDVGSRDNHYVPSGFMPDGKCLNFNDRWQETCKEGSTCMRIEYDLECSRDGQRWAGIYWLNPPNNWGSRKGGFDLKGATKLTFWARGEAGGEQIEEFTVGGITGDYPDSDKIVFGPVILSSEWKQYTVDLRGKDLAYISGGFAWATNEEVNGDSCIFYLDDIKYE